MKKCTCLENSVMEGAVIGVRPSEDYLFIHNGGFEGIIIKNSLKIWSKRLVRPKIIGYDRPVDQVVG